MQLFEIELQKYNYLKRLSVTVVLNHQDCQKVRVAGECRHFYINSSPRGQTGSILFKLTVTVTEMTEK